MWTLRPFSRRYSPIESKEPLSQMMTLQQMTELADGGLVRRVLPPEVDSDETAQDPGIVERFLDRRVREIEPVLQEVDPQQALDADRRAAAALAPGIERLEDGRKLGPRNEAGPSRRETVRGGWACGTSRTLRRRGSLGAWGLSTSRIKSNRRVVTRRHEVTIDTSANKSEIP